MFGQFNEVSQYSGMIEPRLLTLVDSFDAVNILTNNKPTMRATNCDRAFPILKRDRLTGYHDAQLMITQYNTKNTLRLLKH
ncbi:hypothetical protein OK016_17575 [Vibrio chagasii]|nr:hypothetical protein [Vibrio chagasii]